VTHARSVVAPSADMNARFLRPCLASQGEWPGFVVFAAADSVRSGIVGVGVAARHALIANRNSSWDALTFG
jgi:hypothetical protein